MDWFRELSRKLFLKKDYSIDFRYASKLWYSFCVWIVLLLFYLLIGSKISYSVTFTFLLVVWGLFYIFLGLSLYYGDRDVVFANMVKKQTIYFAKNNGLLLKEKQVIESHDLNGNKVRKEKEIWAYTPTVQFRFDSDKLVWMIRKDGHKLSSHYGDIGEMLEGVFRLVLIDSKYDYNCGYYIYVFRRGEVLQDVVSDVLAQEDSVYRIVADNIYITQDFSWNFRKEPHALVCGLTGAGKTFFLAYMLIVILKLKFSFKILDPKRADLSFLDKYFPNEVVSEHNYIAKILREAVAEMRKRFKEFRTHPNYGFGKDYQDYGYKPEFIIFDEYISFIGVCNKKIREEVEEYVSALILEGRQAGIQLILTAQRPDTDYIKGAVRDMLGLRIGFGAMSESGYKMLFGDDGKDIKRTIDDGAGAGFYKTLKMTKKPLEFYAPFMDIDFIPELERIINYKEKVVLDDEEIN